MPSAGRHDLTASTIGLVGYIFGGAYNNTHCDSYDIITWQSELDILPGRGAMASATQGGSAYVCGGTTMSGLDCSSYDGTLWSSKPNMPLPGRNSFAASTILGN